MLTAGAQLACFSFIRPSSSSSSSSVVGRRRRIFFEVFFFKIISKNLPLKGKFFEMVSRALPPGGSGGLGPPEISVHYPCLASAAAVPCPRALPPIFFVRKNFRPKMFSAEKIFDRKFFWPKIFSAENFFDRKIFRPNFFRPSIRPSVRRPSVVRPSPSAQF